MDKHGMDKLVFITLKSIHYLDALAMVVLGVQLFMCIYCLQLYLETPGVARQRRLPYIVFNVAILVLSTAQSFINSEIQFRKLSNSSSGIDRAGDNKLAFAVMLISCSVVFLSDGLMFYRCYIVRYSDSLWLRLLPAVFYIPSLALGLFAIAQYGTPTLGKAAGDIAWPEPTFFFLTVAFNILVTVLIAHRLLQSRTTLQAALPHREMSLYAGITAIVIESAIPLSATGIGYAVLNVMAISGFVNPLVSQVFMNLFGLMYTSFNQLTPTLIIFRVTTGRSWTNNYHQTVSQAGISAEPGQDISLRFHHTTQGGEDIESVDGSKERTQHSQGVREKEGVTQGA